jgi:hypothetical protein
MKYQTGMQIKKAKTTAALKKAVIGERNAEAKLQIQVIELLEKTACRGVVYWHTPNGGKRHIREDVKLKSMGTRSGVCDLILSMPSGEMAFLELKSPFIKSTAKKSCTFEQWSFLWDMYNRGHWVLASKSFDEVYDWFIKIGATTVTQLRDSRAV